MLEFKMLPFAFAFGLTFLEVNSFKNSFFSLQKNKIESLCLRTSFFIIMMRMIINMECKAGLNSKFIISW